MKQYTSVAALALKLTWLPVLLIFGAVGGLQWLSVYRWLTPGGNLIQAGYAFEELIRAAMTGIGYCGFAALLVVLLFRAGETKGTRSGYTLRRLGISEMGVTLTFGGVFTGWFVIYWLFQMGLIFLFYGHYADLAQPGPNTLFLAAYRSEYFHQLLPLREWFGYVRNAALCLGFGYSAAFGAHQLRHRRNAFCSCGIPLAALVLLPREPGHVGLDVGLTILAAGILTGYWFLVKGGDRNETAP